jgi:hypothetical protein
MPEYHGICRNITIFSDGSLTTYFITKVMDLSHFDGKQQTITLYWKFYMLFISLLRVFTKKFESIRLIPPELQRLEE